MRQHKILLVADADFVDAELVHQIGQCVHLHMADVARRLADGLQRDRRDGIAGRAVLVDVGLFPVFEIIAADGHFVVQRLEFRRREIGPDAVQFFLRKLQGAGGFDLFEFALHPALHLFLADGVDQNLDALLVDVVAAAVLIVHAQHRFEISQNILALHEILHQQRDIGRAAHAAAGIDAIADFPGLVLHDLHRHVVPQQRRAVMRRGAHRDLELAREENEFRMQARPLANDLAERPRVFDLLVRRAGEMIRGDVADAIAAGLDAMHLDAREFFQNVGHVHQLDPMELHIGARGEVAVALVVFARDMRQHAHLPAVQRAVGHCDAQHVGVQLQIEAVHQPQRLELVFGQLARKAALHLIAELRHAFFHELGVELVISIHRTLPWKAWPACQGRGGRMVPRRG